jgi:hypothetical protein
MEDRIDFEEHCPKCGSTMEWAPVDCDHAWHRRIKLSTAFNVLASFDAREWAASFMAHLREHPEIVIDYELMVTCLANALMRGYDERELRTPEYKARMRRVLHPWWSWKRYFDHVQAPYVGLGPGGD